MDGVWTGCPVPCGVERCAIGINLLEVSMREVESENERFAYREALTPSAVWIPHVSTHCAEDK